MNMKKISTLLTLTLAGSAFAVTTPSITDGTVQVDGMPVAFLNGADIAGLTTGAGTAASGLLTGSGTEFSTAFTSPTMANLGILLPVGVGQTSNVSNLGAISGSHGVSNTGMGMNTVSSSNSGNALTNTLMTNANTTSNQTSSTHYDASTHTPTTTVAGDTLGASDTVGGGSAGAA